jgi:hypothetical protein
MYLSKSSYLGQSDFSVVDFYLILKFHLWSLLWNLSLIRNYTGPETDVC